MKRFLFVIIAVLFIYPASTQALYVQELTKRYALNDDNQDLGEIFIAMNDTTLPITKENGITLILSAPKWYLWEKSVVTLEARGNAVERGKMAPNPGVRYSADLKSATIAVLNDFAVGDEVALVGLKVKVYNRGSGYQPVGIDLTGDLISDYESPIRVRVDELSAKTDRVPPYSPPTFTAQLKEGPWRVELSWTAPIDYDFEFFDLEKTVEDTTTLLLDSAGLDLTYTDLDVHEYQNITYSLYAKDRRNRSEPATQKVIIAKAALVIPDTPMSFPDLIGESKPESTDSRLRGNDNGVARDDNRESGQPETTEQINTPELSPEERALLTKLFNYYHIRYQIKCLPSGPTVSAGDSACLWAKIDLVYAQERLGRSDVTVSLSAEDTGFIGKRLPYSESRYQAQCARIEFLPRFCTNLKRAIDRANYFLDK